MKKILRLLLILIPATFTVLLSAQVDPAISEIVTNWSNKSDLTSASVGFYAVDVESGGELVNFNGDKAMIPASMMKLSTTIAALEQLGANKTFRTGLRHSGYIDDHGVLHGNIYLFGEGDPAFGSSRIGKDPEVLINEFASAIHAAGIRTINGDVIVDHSKFTPQIPGTWSWEDLTNYYAAIPQPVNFLENVFSVIFKTGSIGEAAGIIRISPEIPGLVVDHDVVAADISNDQTFCFGHPEQNNIVVRGMLPANRSSYTIKGAIPQPGLYFASSVMKTAEKLGVEWKGDVEVQYENDLSKEDLKDLHHHNSPPLHEIVRETNRRSVNLFAEALVVLMGKETNGMEAGIKSVEDFWKSRLTGGISGLNIKDGSGLSHYNTITAKQLTQMLRYGYSGTNRHWLMQSLPVAGQSGTLKYFGTGTVLDGNLHAKSGYMTGNRGYAGFVTTQSGRMLAFSLIVNHYDISAVEMRRKMETLLQELVKGL